MMTSGFMWYDADKTATPAAKLADAVAVYQAKYGHAPTECHVAPGAEFDGGAIKIVGDRWIRADFFWLGHDS